MSLIVDINPVPWKILDLVRARILKNRAKKKKQGMNWSTDEVKRAMALQPHPLSKLRKEEPSFIFDNSISISYTLGEHTRVRIASNVPFGVVYLVDYWQLYKQVEDKEKRKAYICSTNDSEMVDYLETVDSLGLEGNTLTAGILWYEELGPLRTLVYISNFINPETGDSISAAVDVISIGYGVDGPVAGISSHFGTNSMPPVESYADTPYWAWPSRDGGYPDLINIDPYPKDRPLPDPLYDISKLEAIPGYVNTVVTEYYE
jgi:hypothetical protein